MRRLLNIDILATLVWGVLFLQLWLTGRLYLLIHPNYKSLTIVAGMGLVVLAVLQLFRPVKGKGEHISLLPNQWSSFILLGAGILGLVVPPRPFASDIAFQRGINDSFTTVRGVQSFRKSNRSDQRSIVEWVRTLNVYPEPDAYKGQKVNVEGFVVHPKGFPSEFILISRFVITCCAADVYPVGLLVKLPEGVSYAPDRWLRIKGEMTTMEWEGKRKLVILPQELTPIPEPTNPYDY